MATNLVLLMLRYRALMVHLSKISSRYRAHISRAWRVAPRAFGPAVLQGGSAPSTPWGSRNDIR